MIKRVVEICVGTSCHLLGSQDLIEALNRLPQDVRETLDVKGTICLKGCGQGPNVRVDGIVYNAVTPERLFDIID
jgi:NADH:ubiquinone oxidoreductase subunit E